MFYDVHQDMEDKLLEHRVPGAEFDEVTYADDTICITTEIQAMNEFIQKIEWQGFRYGLKLNRNRCELISTHSDADIHFQDNTKIQNVKSATYLGCTLGIKTTFREELGKRFANTMATMKN